MEDRSSSTYDPTIYFSHSLSSSISSLSYQLWHLLLEAELPQRPTPVRASNPTSAMQARLFYSVRMTEYESVLTLSLFILDSKLILHFDLPVFPKIAVEKAFITFLLLFTFHVIGSSSVNLIFPRLNLSSYCFGSSSTAFSILTIFSFFSSLHFVS